MPKGTHLTGIEQGQILAYRHKRITLETIAQAIGRSTTTVYNFLQDSQAQEYEEAAKAV